MDRNEVATKLMALVDENAHALRRLDRLDLALRVVREFIMDGKETVIVAFVHPARAGTLEFAITPEKLEQLIEEDVERVKRNRDLATSVFDKLGEVLEEEDAEKE